MPFSVGSHRHVNLPMRFWHPVGCPAIRRKNDMRTRSLIVLGSLAIFCVLSVAAVTARAEMVFDEANYKALADDPSPDTIPIGTKITLQNWQQYKKFMPVWLQALYSG